MIILPTLKDDAVDLVRSAVDSALGSLYLDTKISQEIEQILIDSLHGHIIHRDQTLESDQKCQLESDIDTVYQHIERLLVCGYPPLF